jgi:TP901 family phage tail tape measure protein
MADRSIKIRLSADVAGLQAGFRTAQKAAADFGSQTQKFAQDNRQSLEQVGQAGMVMGGALAGGLALAVSKFASFDSAMSGVRAATHATEGDMESLRDVAVKAGQDTAFSAEEAARGIEEMAKAGVSTADIIGGGLDGALSLAAAGSIEVGEAADLAATAMTQFGLAGEDIPHIADLLAAGAGKAQGSVQDMGAALKQAGLVADQTGLTIEETTGGLAAFASAGLLGSDAGTSFKSMLQRLTPQSKEASDLMGQLGISAYDAQGNFIGLSEFAGNLQTSMADLTVEQRNAAMATIFGSDAVRASAILYEQGAAGIEKWEQAVSDAGYASETAAIMTDNLKGDLERLGGALDTVFLQSGSGANDALRGIVQAAEDVVDMVGNIPGPVLNTVAAVAGLTGGALLLGGAFVTVVPRIADTVGAIGDLRAKAPGAATALGKIGRAAGIAAASLAAINTAASLASGAVEDMRTKTSAGGFANALAGIAEKGDDAAASIDRMFNGVSKPGSELFTAVNDLEGALNRVFNPTRDDSINDFVSTLTMNNATSGINNAKGALNDLDTAMSDTFTSGNTEDAAATFDLLKAKADELGVPIDELVAQFPQYRDAVTQAATANGVHQMSQTDLVEAMLGTGPAAEAAAAALTHEGEAAAATAALNEEITERLSELGITAEGTVVSLDKFTTALFNSGLAQQSARGATASYEAALDAAKLMADELANGTINLGDVLNGTATDFNLTTDAGRNANETFQAVASQGMSMIEAKAKAGVGQPELQANLRGTYDSLIVAAGGMGITGGAADSLARQVMGIPKEVNIDSYMSDAAKRMAQETTGALDAVDGRVVNAYANFYETTIKREIREAATVDTGASDRGYSSNNTPGLATGGAIYGPGTATSDTAGLFRLSAGEHVFTAREVREMGGQKAVYRFRSQLAGGFPGYADGGAVMRSRSVGGATYGHMSGGSVDNSTHVRVDAGPGVAYEYAKAVGREAAMKTRDTMVSLGLTR